MVRVKPLKWRRVGDRRQEATMLWRHCVVEPLLDGEWFLYTPDGYWTFKTEAAAKRAADRKHAKLVLKELERAKKWLM